MKISTLIIGGALAATLAACSAPGPERYANEKPRLDIQDYFNGTLDAHGMFQDRSGAVVKRFVVVIECRWEGDTGTLDEQFTYSDGTRQQRVWTITKLSGGRFSATAPDVIGTAQGIASGNSLRWTYVLALPVNGTVRHVDMDDWMFLVDDKVMLNRTEMSKFGIGVGSVTLSFTKRAQAAGR